MPDIDPLEVYKLRQQHQLSFRQIADITGNTPGGVHKSYQQLLDTLGTRHDIDAYSNARAQLLGAVEHRLVASIVDPDKLEKASLNNVAYALTQVHTMRRLEQGQSTNNIAVLSQVISSAKHRLVQDLKQESGKEIPK